MAEPTWENTAPIEAAAASTPEQTRAPATEQPPTWDNTFDPAEKYGTPMQQLATGAEGAASAATFGLSTGLEKALGVPEEDIQGRREENPVSHGIGQGVGLVGSALIPGMAEGEAFHALSANSILKGIGEAAAKFGPEGEALAASIARGGLKGAAETALFQAGDETSKMLSNDPSESVQNAAVNIGMAGLLGGAGGAALGAVSPLWKSVNQTKAGQAIADFAGRAKEYLNNPEPAAAVTDELQNHYNNITKMADEVYGGSGLKAQEIAKLLPEATPKAMEGISEQTSNLMEHIDSSLEKLSGDPHENLLRKAADSYMDELSQNQTPEGVFNATQKMKQQLQEWSRVSSVGNVPIADKAFIKTAQDLGTAFRDSLENPRVWGGAGKRQQAINEAFKEYLPALKDFEKRFTAPFSDGSRQIDPGKVATYVNQLGKPNAEIKQEMLKSFLDASEKYQNTIADTHSNLGIDNPFTHTSLSSTKATLGDLSHGAQLFDSIVRKKLGGSTAGKVGGGAVGAILGKLTGVGGGIGAIIGEHSLGSIFDSVFPSVLKPFLEAEASGAGAKAATDYGMQVVKGALIASNAAKAVFEPGQHIIPERLVATTDSTRKLDERAKKLGDDPSELFDMGTGIGHYLPNHTTALSQTTANVVNYLNSERPKPVKPNAFDKVIPPTTAEKQAFQRTLNIAQQPLTVLQHAKDGTLQSKDVKDLNAMYPQLYRGLRQKVYESLTNHVSKDGKIPYRLRMNLSLFVGEPLDATLSPGAIRSAQETFVNAPEPGQQQPQEKPKKSTSQLSKISQTAETPSQAREANKRS